VQEEWKVTETGNVGNSRREEEQEQIRNEVVKIFMKMEGVKKTWRNGG
jgi:hypothetical protein